MSSIGFWKRDYKPEHDQDHELEDEDIIDDVYSTEELLDEMSWYFYLKFKDKVKRAGVPLFDIPEFTPCCIMELFS